MDRLIINFGLDIFVFINNYIKLNNDDFFFEINIVKSQLQISQICTN